MTAKSKTRRAKGKTQRWKATNNFHSKRPAYGCERAVEYSDEMIESILRLDSLPPDPDAPTDPNELQAWLNGESSL